MFTATSNVIAFTLLGGAHNPAAWRRDGNGGEDKDRSNKEQEGWLKITNFTPHQ